VQTTSGADLEASSAGQDIRYVQLGTGRCRCRRISARTERLLLSYESWSVGMLKIGRPLRGAVTFLVPIGRSGLPRIQGRPVAAGEVVVLFDGDEFDYRSTEPAQLVSVSFERRVLEALVRARLGRHLGELRLRGRLAGLRADERVLRRLRRALARRAATDPQLRADTALARSLERKLVKILLAGFEMARKPEPSSRGRTLARRADAFLRRNLAEPPSIGSICAALNASERTLHEAFREHLGTTPKAYLKTLRLNAARLDLLRAVARKKVTDVALDWGFLHFGWFSQDYRRLFAETPSQTLRRGRAFRLPMERAAPFARGA
jgi:AraC family ethanolamine operon transcriptional activator